MTLCGLAKILLDTPSFRVEATQEEDFQVVIFLVPVSLSVASMPWHCRPYTSSTGVNSRVSLGITSTVGTGQ